MSTNFIECKELTLQSAIGTSDTTVVVTGAYRYDGTIITEADFGGAGAVMYATIEPKTDRQESLACVWVSNVAGVMTMTVTRALSGVAPYGTGGVAYNHSAGSAFIFSNSAALFNKLTAKDNDEAITGDWTVPTPSTDAGIANKEYADTKMSKTGDEEIAGEKTFTTAPKIPDSTAADEAITRGEFDAEAATLTEDQTINGIKTFSDSPIVPTATTATQAVNKAQVESYIAPLSGDIKASDTAYGTTKLDVAADTPSDPVALTATADRVAALGGTAGTPGPTNKFVTEEGMTDIQIFDANGTWTKPTGATLIEVLVWGGGGGGAQTDSFSAAGGGGGGGFSRAIFDEGKAGSSETITIGVGGVAGTGTGHGGNGGTSSFGSLVLAYGGKGGQVNNPSTSATTFVEGGTPVAVGTSTSATVPTGFEIFRGGWGGGMISSTGYAGGISMYGGGGGGCAGGSAAGGKSYSGGNGGAGGNPASNGEVPGGGGGGGVIGVAGDGAIGRIIVISHFT